MKQQLKVYALTTLATLPFAGLLYYFLFPPQCPASYTQEQVDASRCIIGANIGGVPLFVLGIVIVWFLVRWILARLLRRKGLPPKSK